MKKNDIAVLIAIIMFTALIGYGIGKMVFGQKSAQPVTVKTAVPISVTITQPSKTVFNSKAINPTVPITISGNTQNPLGN